MMRNSILLFILYTIFPICKAQVDTENSFAAGLNFTTFIGKTIEIKGVYTNHPLYYRTITSGIMFSNHYAARRGDPYDGTSDHINSGIYLGIGSRLTPGKSFLSNYPFLGAKVYSGYYKQSANYDTQLFVFSNNFYYEKDRVYSEGIYVGIAGEIGYVFLIYNRINLELGFEYGHELYTTHRRISSHYSRFPGMGIFHLKGLVAVYYIF